VILASDVGGTRTRLALFDKVENPPRRLKVYCSKEFSSLSGIIRHFLDDGNEELSAACLAVAGPVRHGMVKTPNLPWTIDQAQMARVTGVTNIHLINDLEATAWGISRLDPQDFVTLNTGEADREGNAALIAAGTGLGEAGLMRVNGIWHPIASEGGHVDFAPRDELQLDLLRYLERRYGHVSYERVLSGPGLHNIFCFLRETGRFTSPDWLDEAVRLGDPAAEIASAAIHKAIPICLEAIEIFVSIYGAEAGNLALKLYASGGVFIGGGIAPKLLEALRKPVFLESFAGKGRLEEVLLKIPIQIITNELTALLGAACVAGK
jgi:glucokinase